MNGGAVRNQNTIVTRFTEAGAMAPDTSQTLDELGLRESSTLRRLRDRGLIAQTGDGRYYCDAAALERFLTVRRRRAVAIAAVLGAVLVSLFLAAALGPVLFS